MKPYTNKLDRVSSERCTFSEIEKGSKARKVANRRDSKKEIQQMIREDEEIGEERLIEEMESDIYQEENYEDFEEYEEEQRLSRRYTPYYIEEEVEEDEDYCPCCGMRM
jgi:hypothetical protein